MFFIWPGADVSIIKEQNFNVSVDREISAPDRDISWRDQEEVM